MGLLWLRSNFDFGLCFAWTFFGCGAVSRRCCYCACVAGHLPRRPPPSVCFRNHPNTQTTPQNAARHGTTRHVATRHLSHPPQDLGGTTRDRLIVLAESAVRGLNIPNFPPASKSGNGNESGSKPSELSRMTREEAEEYVGTSPALSEEEAFRAFLEREVRVWYAGVQIRPSSIAPCCWFCDV